MFAAVVVSASEDTSSEKIFILQNGKHFANMRGWFMEPTTSMEDLNKEFERDRRNAAQEKMGRLFSALQDDFFLGNVVLAGASGAAICGKNAYSLSQKTVGLPPTPFRRGKILLSGHAALAFAGTSALAFCILYSICPVRDAYHDSMKENDKFNQVAQGGQVYFSSNKMSVNETYDEEATIAFNKAQPTYSFFSWLLLGLGKKQT